MVIKISTFAIPRPYNIYPKLDFGLKIPSDNPAPDQAVYRFFK
jgi:hypothetical protein